MEIWLQGGIDSRTVQAYVDDTGSGGISGSVQADCSTVDIDTTHPDYVGFDLTAKATSNCGASGTQDRFGVGGTVFLVGPRFLPSPPDGAYFAEACFDVSLDAIGEFTFNYLGAPTTVTIIFDAAGAPIPTAVFDPLVIVVPPRFSGQWALRSDTGPGARRDHTLAYDSSRGVVVLFGGRQGSDVVGDTWEWDGSAWTQVATTGPLARFGAAMAYDSARQVTVLFGGQVGTTYLGDTWEWDGTTWTQAATTGPSARVSTAMAYDSARQVSVLFGGWGGSRRGDTWEWDGAAWTQVSSTGPSPRYGHGMAYDSTRGVVTLFSGETCGPTCHDPNTWEWNGSTWSLRATTGPAPRRGFGMVYDALRAVTVLFGGWDGSMRYGDTWVWDGTGWTELPIAGPSPRFGHAMAYDDAHGVTLLFGGLDADGEDGETWELTLEGDPWESWIRINEVSFNPPVGQPQWVELYKGGGDAEDISGYVLTDEDGNDYTIPAALPSVPLGAFVLVYFDELGSAANDYDFGDNVARLHSEPGLANPLDPAGDQVSLYLSGNMSSDSITSFVAWGDSPGVDASNAVSGGVWGCEIDIIGVSALAVFIGPVATIDEGGTAGIFPDEPLITLAHWVGYEAPAASPGAANSPPTPVLYLPPDDIQVEDGQGTFNWVPIVGTARYHFQLASDPGFASPTIDDDTLTVAAFTPVAPIANGTHFWRVRGIDANDPPGPWSETRSLTIGFPLAPPPDAGQIDGTQHRPTGTQSALQVPSLKARKDGKLLCLHGHECTEDNSANQAWDDTHVAAPHWGEHERMYCVPTAAVMLAAHYRGAVPLDEIVTIEEVAYHVWHSQTSGPEGDLGHNRGYRLADQATALRFALQTTDAKLHFTTTQPSDAELIAYIDAGRPLCCDIWSTSQRKLWHAMVVDQYRWRAGRLQAHFLNTDNNGTPGWAYWRGQGSLQSLWGGAFIPDADVQGRQSDPRVKTDADGDGVMDFDEDERFQSVKGDSDTDGDEVGDKEDIKNYTFHSQYHVHRKNGWRHIHSKIADIDKDGKRSENDCDSDNDGDFDGGEDINGDGHNPDSGETCMFFKKRPHQLLKVNVDKDEYLVGEPVYIVDVEGSRESRTFHGDSWYAYEVGQGCPKKSKGDPLVPLDGQFDTDAGGRAIQELVDYCPAPGQYYLIVDVLDDWLYSTPDNKDPQTCWTCVARACASDVDCYNEDVCTHDYCLEEACTYVSNRYGDIDGNGFITLADLFCVLDGYAGDFSNCSFEQDDIHGACGPGLPNCCPNGAITLADLFAVLDAFGGEDPCCGG